MPSSKDFFVSASLTLIIISGSFFVIEKKLFAAAGEARGHVFISEVMFAGMDDGGEADANDEFIELYNAGDSGIDLKGCALRRLSETGKEYNLLSDLGAVIPAHGYLLVVPRDGDCADGKCYRGEVEPDRCYSTKSFLSENNGIAFYDSADEMIDSVGWGNVASGSIRVFAGSFSAGESIGRKIAAGASEDDEFYLKTMPGPQNSGSVQIADSGDGKDEAEASVEEVSSENIPLESEESGSARSGAFVSEDIMVSEILIDPEGDDGKMEFIELYNAGSAAVDLEGWSLSDLAGKTGVFAIPAGARLGAAGYRVFYSSETGLSLNNSGDGVALRNSAGALVSETGVGGTAAAGVAFALDDGHAWVWTVTPTPGKANVIEAPAKSEDIKVAEEESFDGKSSDTEKAGVSGEKAVAPAASDYDFSDNIFINEIFPDPPGRDNREGAFEWVELYNDNDRAVDLKGWYLDDATDRGSKPFRFLESRIVPAKGYLVVSSEESKIAFNNIEEEVNLLWPDEKAEDTRSYRKAGEDEVYVLSPEGEWFWTPGKTPGAKNAEVYASVETVKSSYRNSVDFIEMEYEDEDGGEVLGADDADKENYDLLPIDEVKRASTGTRVGMVGVVSAPSSVFGGNVIYLADKFSGAGMQVFSRNEQLPELALGDEVQAFGSVSEVGGEKRLVPDLPLEKTGSNNLLRIASARGADMGENILGGLVKMEGSVAERVDSRLFFLRDEAGDKIKIYAKPETGILFDNIKAGDRIAVTGIVSRTSQGYRLLPRFSTDVRFLERSIGAIMAADDSPEEELVRSAPLMRTGLLFLLALFILSDWLWMRIRSRKKAVASGKE